MAGEVGSAHDQRAWPPHVSGNRTAPPLQPDNLCCEALLSALLVHLALWMMGTDTGLMDLRLMCNYRARHGIMAA